VSEPLTYQQLLALYHEKLRFWWDFEVARALGKPIVLRYRGFEDE
jgi:hypothetical protein